MLSPARGGPRSRAGRTARSGIAGVSVLCVVLVAIIGGPMARWGGHLIRVAHAGGRRVAGVLNLNTAPPELLALLPGVGPSKARGILVYRARHPFRTVDELVRVKGIGRRMVREMRSHLAISGPSTIRALPPSAGGDAIPASPIIVLSPRTPATTHAAAPALRPMPRAIPPPVHPASGSMRRPGPDRATRALRAAANHCARPP